MDLVGLVLFQRRSKKFRACRISGWLEGAWSRALGFEVVVVEVAAGEVLLEPASRRVVPFWFWCSRYLAWHCFAVGVAPAYRNASGLQISRDLAIGDSVFLAPERIFIRVQENSKFDATLVGVDQRLDDVAVGEIEHGQIQPFA